jgi:hypothetical protein
MRCLRVELVLHSGGYPQRARPIGQECRSFSEPSRTRDLRFAQPCELVGERLAPGTNLIRAVLPIIDERRGQ